MESKLELTYTPEKKDYVKASRALAKKTTLFIILAGVLALGVIASAVILLVPSIGNATWRNIAVAVLWVGIFYVVYYLVLIPVQLSRAYKKNEFMKMERRFTLTDANLLMAIGDKSQELEWEHLRKVIYDGGLYLMVYKEDSPVYPFIHERAFKDDAEKAAFENFLKEKSITIQ
ncbi:MAG: hypothetical protein U9R53_08435 [Chloroflexota bacterium]|nr:hypothetical protein [Chloroflexota bacterium]